MLTTQSKEMQPTTSSTIAAIAFELPRMLEAPLFLVFVGEAAEAVAEPVAKEVWPGLLLSSSANGVIAKPEMTVPLASSTCWVTFVAVTDTNLPVGLFAIPLSIRVCAPGGTAGMVKLLSKAELEIRDASHFGGTTDVFCALRP